MPLHSPVQCPSRATDGLRHHHEDVMTASDHCVHRLRPHHSSEEDEVILTTCWNTASTTPMTTRPHFPNRGCDDDDEGSGRSRLRRNRARSWGAYQDDNDGEANSLLGASRNSSLKAAPSLLGSWRRLDDNTDPIPVHDESGSSKTHSPRRPQGASLYDTAAAASSLSPYQRQPRPCPNDKDDSSNNKSTTPLFISFTYGAINAIIVLPVLMSFGSIIYRDAAYNAYMPVLVKLTICSGIVHQLCFATLSTLPFAVGQVQDAGLIFLSRMASDIAAYCHSHDASETQLLATATVGLGLCTAVLGVGVVAIGQLRLAQYVQKLPTCVVGGYLAYIGWFCGVSGVGLMAGETSAVTWHGVMTHWQLVWPGLAGGVLIYVAVSRLRHMAVLPTTIAGLLVLFYMVLWCTGSSLQNVTEQGWVRQMDPPPPWYRTWEFLQPQHVLWSALPPMALTEISMIFVVALSSSLDVAAIEIELNRPLNYNRELTMVGISNIASGLTGGYTGSYIFSQSIFSLRAGIRSRVSGYCLAACQIVVVLLPVPILSYVPNFFFGSLLSMICVDLMYEWLWDVRRKVGALEYAICLVTFGAIQVVGVEYGILVGVAIYAVAYKLGLDVGDNTGKEDMVAENDENGGEKHIDPALPENGNGQYGSTD